MPVPGRYPIVVGLPQLLLIEALADATPDPVATASAPLPSAPPCSEADLASFVQRLRDLGYLRATPARVPTRRPPATASAPAPQLAGQTIVVPTPCTALVADGAFALWDHAGRHGVALGARRAARAARVDRGAHVGRRARRARRPRRQRRALASGLRRSRLAALCAAGFAHLSDDRGPAAHIFGSDGSLAATLSRQATRLKTVFARRAAEQDAAEAARAARTGRVRPRVVPVAFDACPPLALGLITAYAQGLRRRPARRALRLPPRLGVARGALRPAHRASRRSTCSRTTCGRTRSACEISEQVKAREPGEHHDPRRARHAQVRGRRRATYFRGEPARRRHRPRRGRGRPRSRCSTR